MKSLSLKAGLTETAFKDALSRGRSPSIDNFVAMAEALGVSPIWLLQGDERFRLKVPLVGTAREHEGWTVAKTEKDADFDLDLASSDVFCIRIEGDANAPFYRDGDEVLCKRLAGKFFDNLVGTDCVVQTVDGIRYIKVLAKGSKPGAYSLRSLSAGVKDIENVRLAWAAPIMMVKRATSV